MCDEEICVLRRARFKALLQKIVGKLSWLERDSTYINSKLRSIALDFEDANDILTKLLDMHKKIKEVE